MQTFFGLKSLSYNYLVLFHCIGRKPMSYCKRLIYKEKIVRRNYCTRKGTIIVIQKREPKNSSSLTTKSARSQLITKVVAFKFHPNNGPSISCNSSGTMAFLMFTIQ